MKHFYLTFVLFFVAQIANAQTQYAKPGDKIDSLRTVTAVSACEEFTWIGTNNGICRISKKSGKKNYYSTTNTPLQSNHITSVCCRANGDVWIGTPKGILFYDGYAFNVVDIDNSKLPENFITSMKEDKNNDLWIGTSKSGLVKVHRNRFFIYNVANSSLNDNNICTIKTDLKDNLVITSYTNDSILTSCLVKK